MTEQQMREEFEAQVKNKFDYDNSVFISDIYSNDYISDEVNDMWWAWKTAKEQSNKDIEELKAQRDFYEERWKEVS